MNDAFWKDRPVLITGGAGFLGNHLAGKLVKAGASVTIIARDDVRLGLRWCVDRVAYGNVCDQAFVERVLGENEIDTVFHLAAQVIVPIANRNPVSTFESNIKGTWSVLEACRRSPKVERIVVASTDKVYGEVQDNQSYREDDRLDAVHPYDVSKLCADVLAQSYARTYDMNIAITRSGNYYGPGDHNWSRIVPGTIRSIIRGQRPVIRSSGNQTREYFYIMDAVDANMVLAESMYGFRGAAFNFSSGEGYSTREVVQIILDGMGSDFKPNIHGNDNGEIDKQLLDCSKAKSLLGWEPRFSFRKGLVPTIEYYKEVLDESCYRE